MPWTVDEPPAVAKNKTLRERRVCVAAANATLSKGGTDEEAIHACIGAIENVDENTKTKRGDAAGVKRDRFG